MIELTTELRLSLKQRIDSIIKKVSISTDYNEGSELQKKIKEKTGQRLSASTLKRMVGLVDENRKINPTSLNIVARFLDCNDCNILIDDLKTTHSPVIQKTLSLDFNKLSHSCDIRIMLLPKGELLLKHKVDNSYEVIESQSLILKIGDDLILSQKNTIGSKLQCLEVIRTIGKTRHSLGFYESATNSMIKSIAFE